MRTRGRGRRSSEIPRGRATSSVGPPAGAAGAAGGRTCGRSSPLPIPLLLPHPGPVGGPKGATSHALGSDCGRAGVRRGEVRRQRGMNPVTRSREREEPGRFSPVVCERDGGETAAGRVFCRGFTLALESPGLALLVVVVLRSRRVGGSLAPGPDPGHYQRLILLNSEG